MPPPAPPSSPPLAARIVDPKALAPGLFQTPTWGAQEVRPTRRWYVGAWSVYDPGTIMGDLYRTLKKLNFVCHHFVWPFDLLLITFFSVILSDRVGKSSPSIVFVPSIPWIISLSLYQKSVK